MLICAGGTGGGVYPALAVHNALVQERPALQTLWVGGEGGMEESLVKRAGIPFVTIPAAGLHGVGLRALPGNAIKLMRGFAASRRILREFKPEALFFTGGYLAGPMALAGLNIPTLLYVPDIEPALALKMIARFADCIAVTTPDSRRYFPGRDSVVDTGYPVRAGFARQERGAARVKLNLHNDKPVLMIWGGSRGARSINQAAIQHLPGLLERAQVIHVSGELDWSQTQAMQASLAEAQRRDYHAYAYLHEEMNSAMSAADLIVSRAGASVLGEYPLLGAPAILVPYPHAWRYQKVNANYLARRGAAMILEDSQLDHELLIVVQTLLNDPAKLQAMRVAMQSLSRPDAARVIASQILGLAGEERL
ncbi:MAG: UDP-N-acetylglucosamine--N-acetylmuramyl-(pentapeptide) pyrophosphoryl-undecaprenol N-acetylglucosamine transferase [Anaerolineales bacterium]|nr:UDP-N-acetylglucosamine--N-acetylmuramyl-(pentapeptide) pyrophosphoryl-undecaprenol N-acetylglucosamine transferase [Anaerolineales bacterium]